MCDVVTGLGHGRYSMELSLHDAAWTSDGYQFVILNPRTSRCIQHQMRRQHTRTHSYYHWFALRRWV